MFGNFGTQVIKWASCCWTKDARDFGSLTRIEMEAVPSEDVFKEPIRPAPSRLACRNPGFSDSLL